MVLEDEPMGEKTGKTDFLNDLLLPRQHTQEI